MAGTTVLLLHGDGSDASTTISDSSPAGHGNATVAGNAQLDTAQSKFGGSSILFDGAGDYLTYADHNDWTFGANDFTVEGWVRFPTNATELICPRSSAFVDGDQDSSVKLLLHMDGVDAATATSDSSPSAHGAATFFGNAQLDTAQSKYGSASLLLDGTGDYIRFADHADYDLGTAFTIEAWVRFNTVATGNYAIVTKHNATGNQRGFTFRFNSVSNGGVGSTLEFNYSLNGTTTTALTGSWSPVINTWYHVAVVRFSGVLWLMVDGVFLAHDDGAIGSSTIFANTDPLHIGTFNASGTPSQFFNGWIDELRISNGAARYLRQAICTHYAASGDQRGWWVRKNLGSSWSFGFSTDGIATNNVDSAWAPLPDTWYYFTVVRDGATLRFFIDGVQISTSGTLGSSTIFGGTSVLNVGRFDTAAGFESYLTGWLDDLRITNPGALYHGDFTPPTKPLKPTNPKGGGKPGKGGTPTSARTTSRQPIMSYDIYKDTADVPLLFLMVLTTDGTSPATGLSPTVTLSKNGAAFGAPSGAVTELSAGWYKVAANATDSNTFGALLLHATGTGADNTDVQYFVKKSNIKKNQQLAGFTFVMTDSTTHAPATGLTVTATRSLDGAAFGACANAVAEIASGVYKITLAAADTNGDTVTLRFTATAADDKIIEIVTDP